MSSLQRFSFVFLIAGHCIACSGSGADGGAGAEPSSAEAVGGAGAKSAAIAGSQSPNAGARSSANAAAGSAGGAKSNVSQASAPVSSQGNGGAGAGAGGTGLTPAANGGAGAAAGMTASASAGAASVQAGAASPSAGNNFVDSFDGDGPLLGYTTNNASAIPDVTRISGRYNAKVLTNANDITLHYNQSQGRIDARKLSFPFEAIARNVGIGTIADSQTAVGGGILYNLAGIQVRVLEFESRNSAHLVVGHSGTANFSIEGKSTVDGVSTWENEGANVAPLGRADLRVVGNADQTISVYWQAPNADPAAQKDAWKPYKGTGKLSGPPPDFGPEVYVGLITYAVGEPGVPFVGTCDSFEGTEQ